MKLLRWLRAGSERRRKTRLRRSFGGIGRNVTLGDGSEFGNPENIVLGSHVYVGGGASFWALGGLRIEDNVVIGPRVTIHTSNHRYEEAEAIPYDGVTLLAPVTIGGNVWIGAGAMLTPGTEIGEGAVVGMGAVVAGRIPKGAVVVGNPAKVVKFRDLDRYERLKAEGKFYLELKAQGLIHHELRRVE